MLLAFYPPWIVIGSTASGDTVAPKSFGYASIWEPPGEDSLRGAMVGVDIPRLLMEDVAALVPIVILWFLTGPFRREMEKAEEQENKYHGPEANQNMSRQLRVILVLVTLGCILSAVLLLKDHLGSSRLSGAHSSAAP